MRNYKRTSLLILMTALVLWTSVQTVSRADSSTTIYWIIRNSEDNNTRIEVGTQEVIYDNILDVIDLENLEMAPNYINVHHSYVSEASDLQTLTDDLRQYLLRMGYARLADPDIAPEREQTAQQQAQEKQAGVWAPTPSPAKPENGNHPDPKEKDTAIPAWIENSKAFFVKNSSQILSFIGGCGILSFLAGVIIKRFRTRKKVIYLGGWNASGKSTLLRYLLNPDASYKDLLNQSPTSALTKERIIRDDASKKLIITADLLDAPGHELQYAIDQLVLTRRKRLSAKKYIIIIVAAPTKEYRKTNRIIDSDYIEQQLQSISLFWSFLLKAKKTVAPESVVLFVNKLDLYDDPAEIRELFSRHETLLASVCRNAKIDFSCIYGSVLDKSGMTDLMNVIKKRS